MLLPVSYAGFVFGMEAGLVSLVIASAIMIPRIFLISQYFPDALLETIGVIVIGVLINLWINGYRRERERRRHMLSELEKAHRELQLRTSNLELSERRYRELFENAHDAIWEHDLEGNITAANRASEALGGYNRKELIGMNVRTFLTEDSLNLAGHIRSNLFSGEPTEQPYEQRLIRRDGTVAILLLTTSLIREDGKPTGFLHIARDVTKEKEIQDKLAVAYRELSESHRQLVESQDRLIQAEKLTSLGQLAASVAHEINNPLAGVLTYTQLLIKKIESDRYSKDETLRYLNTMGAAVTHSSNLVRSLLDFARQSPPMFAKVDMNEVIRRSIDLAAHSAELQHVEITKHLAPSLHSIEADFNQLQQVFTNLIMNAIEAMPSGGNLVIRSSTDAGFMKIEVQDNGVGISQENLKKLFTPFFTTKREVKGVGLGLAVSYGIIERHGGRIEVQSELGKGSTFTVVLPVHQEGKQA
jgi:PAS domain S-box-containing protein